MRRVARLAPVLLAVGLAAGAGPPATPPPPAVPLRVVGLGGAIDRDDVAAHLAFSVGAGFNALWIPGREAGHWTGAGDPQIAPSFTRLLTWCAEHGMRPIVAIAPIEESDGAFVHSDPRWGQRLVAFARALRGAGVDELALDFQRAPRRLTDVRDIATFGRQSLPAELAALDVIIAATAADERVWFAPSAFSDLQLAEEPDAAAALAGLARRPARVGLVWAGARPVSPTIGPEDLAHARKLVGARPILLHDRYPGDLSSGRLATAVPLAPLRGRDPALRSAVAGWLCLPAHPLAASRLALSTVAEYLADPAGYDPDAAWQRARGRLAGDDTGARQALEVQAMEWGGFIGERNHRSALTDNPAGAARDLRDPGAAALYVWTVRRYPERMAALSAMRDTAFRDALLEVMARRLAIARAMPAVRELRARRARGDNDEDTLREQLRQERRRAAATPSAAEALDRFLSAAGLSGIIAPAATPSEP